MLLIFKILAIQKLLFRETYHRFMTTAFFSYSSGDSNLILFRVFSALKGATDSILS